MATCCAASVTLAQYQQEVRDCDADGLRCLDGACRDVCYQNLCDTPPDPF